MDNEFYNDNIVQETVAWTRTYGTLPVVPKCKSTAVALSTAFTKSERESLAKLEDAHTKALNAACALTVRQRTQFVDDGERGKAAKGLIEARYALIAGSAAALEAVEANADAIEESTHAAEAAARQGLLDALYRAREFGAAYGAARQTRAAIRDNNPLARLAPVARVPRMPSAKALEQLIASIEAVDQPTDVWVTPANYVLLQNRQPGAVDINGNPVASLNGKVKVSYGAEWDGSGNAARSAVS